ncbi:MAG: hypothetical protein H7144_03070 [Burkholderiales bacterium]|nr:hypothetical protein [Phycisphaerae bacterium]
MIEIDEGTYQRLQNVAQLRRISVEKLVAEAAGQLADAAPSGVPQTIADFLDSVKDIQINTRGWKWNRDELYDRKALR